MITFCLHELGQRLRFYRKREHLTQHEIAHRMGCNPTVVSTLERLKITVEQTLANTLGLVKPRGDLLRQARKKLGLRQSQLAEIAGCQQVDISGLERLTESAVLKADALLKSATETFECTVSQINDQRGFAICTSTEDRSTHLLHISTLRGSGDRLSSIVRVGQRLRGIKKYDRIGERFVFVPRLNYKST